MDVRPLESLVIRVQRLVAPLQPVAWTRAERGYTPAERWVVQLGDGSSAFVKGAVDEATAGWLRVEHRVYTTIEAGYLPELRGWDDDGKSPVLLLEDLSAAYWPPPWRPGDVGPVLDALAKVRATPPPDWVPAQDRQRLRGWPIVAEFFDAPVGAVPLEALIWNLIHRLHGLRETSTPPGLVGIDPDPHLKTMLPGDRTAVVSLRFLRDFGEHDAVASGGAPDPQPRLAQVCTDRQGQDSHPPGDPPYPAAGEYQAGA